MAATSHSGKRGWFFLLGVIAAGGWPCGAADLSQEAEALLARARELSSIRAGGSPPFLLRGRLRLVSVPNGPIEGTYEEVRDSHGKWRRVLSLPDLKFQVVEVSDGRRIYRAGSNAYQPYFEYRLRQLLSLRDGPRIPKSEDVTEIHRRKIRNRPAACVYSKRKGMKREVCVDAETSLAAFEREQSGDGKWTFEYLNYAPLGTHSYPRLLREREHKAVFVEIEITELTAGAEPDAALFLPPAGAVDWPDCERPFPPEALETPRPRSPWSARVLMGRRSVITYLVVGMDGRPHQVTPVRSDTLALTKATLDAITLHWRFRPAACQGEPVPAPILVETNFYLF
jgi:hypothetical protein